MKFLSALLLFPMTAAAGPYIEWGLGVPLKPVTGYTPDMYGILSAGYRHNITHMLSIDLQFAHRSLTTADYCNNGYCDGDNAIETKFRLEW
jgi:hypothetical protein